jgi:hypothetical protein
VTRAQLQGSPLPQVLKEDGAITSHADGEWISAEDVSGVVVCARVAATAALVLAPPDVTRAAAAVGHVASRRRRR